MIAYWDFVPQQTRASSSTFLRGESPAEYEDFDAAVAAANAWIAANPGVRIVTVETVTLPNIWREDERGSADGALRTSGESRSFWHQFVRVWYEAP
jgi:hypothetical protein